MVGQESLQFMLKPSKVIKTAAYLGLDVPCQEAEVASGTRSPHPN